MKHLLLAALLAAPIAAAAQVPTGMVLLPRNLADAAAAWIGHPDPTTAVQIFAAMQACVAANGEHARAEGCPAVTKALEGMRKADKHAMPTPATTPAAP